MIRRAMKGRVLQVALVAMSLGVASCTQQEEKTETAPTAPYREGEILVKFKNTVSTQQASAVLSSYGLQSVGQFASIGVQRCRITDARDVPSAVAACNSSA